MTEFQRKLQERHDDAVKDGLAVRFFDVRKTALVIALPDGDPAAASVDKPSAECPPTSPPTSPSS